MLLGPKGEPISSNSYVATGKKSKKFSPLVGEIAPDWSLPVMDNNFRFNISNNLQFDTNRLTLADFRFMLDNYQINSSLSILTFMIHQSDWHIDDAGGPESKKIRDWVQENMEMIWSRLIRAMGVSFWAGHSPCALQFENDSNLNKTVLSKVKDLPPELCDIKWKKVKTADRKGSTSVPAENDITSASNQDGLGVGNNYARIFDGIKRPGFPDIHVDNAFWYPLLMQHGDMTGRKLLKPAFQPWFFSLLIHLYSNRYFERFGEPVMIGRAPYDDSIDVNGQSISGNRLMQGFGSMVRNGAFAVLPNNRVLDGDKTSDKFEYTLEYLESTLRGADFDRYLSRLDEEMSLALFTPLTMMRSGEAGYNTSVGQQQNYDLQLNAISSDMEEYINHYVIPPMVRLNFGDKVKIPKIRFKKRGIMDPETLRVVVAEGLRSGKMKVDVEQLGEFLGMTVEEIEVVTEPLDDPNNPKPVVDPATKKVINPPKDNRVTRTDKPKAPTGVNKKAGATMKAAMSKRVVDQIMAANRTEPDIGCSILYRNWLGGGTTLDTADWGYDLCSRQIKEAYGASIELSLTREESELMIDDAIDRHMQFMEGLNE